MFKWTKAFWHRLTDRDRLCYALVTAFGVCLLALMLFFQFGYMLGEKQIVDNPIVRNEPIQPSEAKLLLIDEPNPVVRGIEVAMAIGMIVLGVERLKTYKKRRNKCTQ